MNKLSNYCIVDSGNGFPLKYQGKTTGKYPFYKVSDMNSDGNSIYMGISNNFVDDEEVKTLKWKIFPEGTLIFPKIGMAIKTNKKRLLSQDSLVDNNVMTLVPKNNVDSKFLYYYFISIDLFSFANATTTPAIRKTDIENHEVNFPPLPVQKQIVSILEKAENLKQKREETNKETQKIIQSLFYEMFGDPVKNEKGWDVKKWDEVLTIINGRSQKKVENPNGKYPIYGSGGIMSYADEYLSPENSVIIGRKGSINKPIKVKTKYWNVDTAFGIVPDTKKLTCDYLFSFCQIFNFERLNTSTTLPSLTKVNLLQIEMPIPPLPLQEEFARKVQLIESIQSKQQSSTQEINTLFDALIQKAFKGELVE